MRKIMNPEQPDKIIKSWKWRMLKAGYKSQSEFADELEISKQVLSNWLNGRNHPNLKTFIKIESLLKGLGV
tara:strand:+ start:81 stop:293 length:213 start_codon:yes stop_codon:yes gene_type:complete